MSRERCTACSKIRKTKEFRIHGCHGKFCKPCRDGGIEITLDGKPVGIITGDIVMKVEGVVNSEQRSKAKVDRGRAAAALHTERVARIKQGSTTSDRRLLRQTGLEPVEVVTTRTKPRAKPKSKPAARKPSKAKRRVPAKSKRRRS